MSFVLSLIFKVGNHIAGSVCFAQLSLLFINELERIANFAAQDERLYRVSRKT